MQHLLMIARALQEASQADIYYDAGYFNDQTGVDAIEEATDAMKDGADLLKHIAAAVEEDYVFPSDADRAENDALDAACDYLEKLLEAIYHGAENEPQDNREIADK